MPSWVFSVAAARMFLSGEVLMQRHIVYFFEEDDHSWLDPIADFVKNGIGQNETVIVIATEQHHLDLKTKLLANKTIGLEASNDTLFYDIGRFNDLAVIYAQWLA
jgi:hypothetical protein